MPYYSINAGTTWSYLIKTKQMRSGDKTTIKIVFPWITEASGFELTYHRNRVFEKVRGKNFAKIVMQNFFEITLQVVFKNFL